MPPDAPYIIYITLLCLMPDIRELKHVGRQHEGDGNQYNESMKRNK
jgi:hypothetical protein